MSIVIGVIAEHLQYHRKLVVPSFGAFVLKESGVCSFLAVMSEDDGVLRALLQARGLSEMEAAVTIDRFIFEVRHELEQRGFCQLGTIGILRFDAEEGGLRLCAPVYSSSAQEDDADGGFDVEESAAKMADANAPQEANAPQSAAPKARRGVDSVTVLAILVIVAALISVTVYGWFVVSRATAEESVETPREEQTELLEGQTEEPTEQTTVEKPAEQTTVEKPVEQGSVDASTSPATEVTKE